ncbi:hypothetical protein BGZ95_004673, partial [Linnemannia exigua]
AFEWHMKTAERGGAEEQFEVEEYLRKGKGMRKNRIMAKLWFQKAADQGNKGAQEALEFLRMAKRGYDESRSQG